MSEDVRSQCHAVLDLLPLDALDEVWKEIRDAWERHRNPLQPVSTNDSPVFIVTRIFEPVVEKPFVLTED